MALGTYKNDFRHSITLGDKDINFRAWTTKDEKEYLILTEDNEHITEDDLFELLLKPCIKENNIILENPEKRLLLLEVRKKSLGSTFDLTYKCSKCQSPNAVSIDIEDIIHFKEPSYKNIKVDNLEFYFDRPVSSNLLNRLKDAKNAIEYNFIDLLIHIRAIKIDDNLEDTFTFDELEEFVNSLPTNIFDKVHREFLEMKGNLELSTEVECITCKHYNKFAFDDISNFLWA